VNVGDLVKLKRVHPDERRDVRGGVGLVVGVEGDPKGWEAYYKVLWGRHFMWESVAELEVVSEGR